MNRALVIGGGPAGLMAAEALLDAGVDVTVADAKPSLGRKFLMAGKSGLNLSKMQEMTEFLSKFGTDTPLRPMLEDFGPTDVRDWAETLGQEMFVGSSGRLYPKSMKASPLLRAWLARLSAKGMHIERRWRWTGWDKEGTAWFETPDGPCRFQADVQILALGGASWARLGSDGAWARCLAKRGVTLAPFAPANVGLDITWSAHMKPHFGAPIKNACFSAGCISNRGEAILSARGLEGGGIYPLTPALRAGHGLFVDLFPDLEAEKLAQRLKKPRGKQSLSNFLRKTLRFTPPTLALVMELARPLPHDPAALARVFKALPIPFNGLRPMDEAISTAGGVPFAQLDQGLMLRPCPGVFCAGEMLDWEAPTGGYLLTACLATGLWAGRHAADYCQR